MKCYRVVVYVLNLNGDVPNINSVKQKIETNRYPEFLTVVDVAETDVGEWSDDHVLNGKNAKWAYGDYFPDYDNPMEPEDDPFIKRELKRCRRIMTSTIERNTNLEMENRSLKKELEKLKSVKDFLKKVKDLKD